MSFERFKATAHEIFVDANQRASEIPDLVREIVTLQNERNLVLQELVDRSQERKTLHTIANIQVRDNSLIGDITSLATSIGTLGPRLLDVSSLSRASLQGIGEEWKNLSEAETHGEERRALLANALASIQVAFSVREFTVGTVLIQLYSLISSYRDVHLAFLRRSTTFGRVKEVTGRLARAAGEDVVSLYVPFLSTAKAVLAEVMTTHLEREIAALGAGMNAFERMFLIERTLEGLAEYAIFVRQLVEGADRDIDLDRRRITEATALIQEK